MVPPLLTKWQKRLGVHVSDFGIKKMKTKWGTCSADAHRIWINLELAKKSPDSLEYVVMHELVHLLVRHHDDRFIEIMDKHLPRWRGPWSTQSAGRGSQSTEAPLSLMATSRFRMASRTTAWQSVWRRSSSLLLTREYASRSAINSCIRLAPSTA